MDETKTMIIQDIINLTSETDDIDLLRLIAMLLHKSKGAKSNEE